MSERLESKLFGVADAALILGISPWTVRRYIAQG